MKQYSHIIRYALALLLFLNAQFLMLNPLRAQGFEWVRTYTGSDLSSGDATNKIIGSCVDSAGNLYILGQFSPYAQLCGERLLPSDVIEPSSPRWQGIVIAKLSPAGELLWHKAIYNGKHGCYAFALRMMGDSCIMAMVVLSLPYDNGHNERMNLYYLDTLLTGNSDYLMPIDSVSSGNYNAFITFDLDGNVTEQHLVCVGYTDTLGNDLTHQFIMGPPHYDKLFAYLMSDESFNVDSEGNIYVVRRTVDAVGGPYNPSTETYQSWRIDEGTIGSMKIVVDGTHFLTYPIPHPTALWNKQILKFSPHFDSLIDAVYIFDISLNNQSGLSLMTTTFDIDNQNNLYIVMGGSQLPDRLRIENSDSLYLRDSVSTPSFMIKYNQDLHATDVIQLSHDGDGQPQLGISRIHIDNETNSLYVTGKTHWSPLITVNCVRYNDDSINIPNKSGFWLRLNKDDLSLVSHGILTPTSDTDGERVWGLSYLETNNNRVFAQCHFYAGMLFADTFIPHPNIGLNNMAAVFWDYKGHELDIIDLGQHSPSSGGTQTHAIDSLLYLTGIIFNDATFGDTTIYHQGYSQAYIAKYVDPEFARPYMHPSDREEQAIEWPQTLAFTLADSPVTLTATATSGLPVSYSCSDSTVAYLEGDQLHLLREGSATVTAMQPGDYYHMPAEPVTKTLRVGSVGIAATEPLAPQLYPNPATNAVRIIPGGERVTAVRLVSALGQPLPAPFSSGRIDLSALPAGIYYLSIITETTSYQHKIVKQ